MCGIAGIISANKSLISNDHLLQMTGVLAHRGPEGEEVWINPSGNCALGHRRLFVIDHPAKGIQPMHFLNRYTIVHDGELFNYGELRDSLFKKGYGFSTNTDTEVIAACFDCFQENCLDHFDGMFAFAIWDEQEKQLFCARDRFGQKPFFFAHDEKTSTIVFASEIKAINSANRPGSINERMLLHFLATGRTEMVTEPFATFYDNITQLPAAHYLYYHPEKAGPETHCYWICDKESISDISDKEAEDKLSELLTASVSRRLRSDVPPGLLLNDGLGSAALIATINQLRPVENLPAFAAGFPGFIDGSIPTNEITERFRINSYRTTPTAKDLLNDLDHFLHIQEMPVASATVYARYKIFELAKNNGTKVLLDGQGAEEIFAGHNRYVHWYLQELLSRGKLTALVKEKKLLRSNHIPFKWGTLNYLSAFLPGLTAKRLEAGEAARILHDGNINEAFIAENFLKTDIYKPVVTKLNDILFFDTFQSGLNELVKYADRNSMAHGRAVRHPFLYHELVSFLFSLPSGLKIRNGFTKWILRAIINKTLPSDIAWRKDTNGLETTGLEWMRDDAVKKAVMESRDFLESRKILRQRAIDKKDQPAEDPSAEWRWLVAGRLIR